MMIMTYYEIKKVFSKKGSKVALIFIFIVISVVLSFIIGDNKYVNHNGDAESGISAMLKVRELKRMCLEKLLKKMSGFHRHRKQSRMILDRMI